MSTRIKSRLPKQRDYEQMLKDYFGFHLYGLEITDWWPSLCTSHLFGFQAYRYRPKGTGTDDARSGVH